MVAPAQRFAPTGEERLAPVALLAADAEPPREPALRIFTRQVSAAGRISFKDHACHVGV